MKSLVFLPSLVAPALGCLKSSATISVGLDVIVSMTLFDNEVITCNGYAENRGGPGNIHRIDGYKLHYQLGAPDNENCVLATYTTPHGTYSYEIADHKDCIYSNCCGGIIPCTCSKCSFSSINFGC